MVSFVSQNLSLMTISTWYQGLKQHHQTTRFASKDKRPVHLFWNYFQKGDRKISFWFFKKVKEKFRFGCFKKVIEKFWFGCFKKGD